MRLTSARTFFIVALLAALAAACGDDSSGGEPDGPDRATSTSGFHVTIAAPEQLEIGPSRFVFALDDPRQRPVLNARAHVKFYFIDPKANNRKTIKSSVDAAQVSLEKRYSFTRDDGETVTMGPGETGVYANEIAFDQPGDWVVEITGAAGTANLGMMEVAFAVGEVAAGLQKGALAPVSIPEIGGALSAGRPTVITFGNLGACYSAVCGPLTEVAHELADAHADEAEYLFFGFATDDASPALPTWATTDWGVGLDQAVFFIDADGVVRGRVETIASYAELEAHLAALLPQVRASY
ncbi:MAG: hypothetical protein WD904_05125 [Dehalococcoidia bacterium]